MRVLTEGALVPKLLLDVLDWEPVKKDRKKWIFDYVFFFFSFPFVKKRKRGDSLKSKTNKSGGTLDLTITAVIFNFFL